MLRDHRRLVVTFADKAGVRDHVVTLGHADLLPRAHAVLDRQPFTPVHVPTP
jgi:hypothetical protein